MNLERSIEKIWKKDLKHELFDNYNYLLWDEKGIVALMFSYLKKCLDDYGRRSLLVPEYRPTVPRYIKCRIHKQTLEKYRGNERWKVDLCIVKFKDYLNKIKFSEECCLWCVEHKPIIAMEFKYKSLSTLKERKGELEKDINKLETMIEKRNTEIAYLCIVTDITDKEKYNELLNLIKNMIKHKREKFRIAVGSWEKKNQEFWNIETC